MIKRLPALCLFALFALPALTVNATDSQSVKMSKHEFTSSGDDGLVDRLRAAGLITEELYRRQQSIHLPATAISTRDDPHTVHRGKSQTDDSNEVRSGRYVALVIGSNEYTEFEVLETAVEDARAIASTLETEFGFETKLVLNPTRRQLISSLSSYRHSLKSNDHFLLYYAGHGYLEQSTSRGYWLPVDAEPDNPSNWISNVEIADAVNSLQAEHVLVIADSCFAGSLAQPTPGFENSETGTGDERSRIVITSGGLEPVLDTGFGRHSIFAQALLDQLTEYTNDSSLTTLFTRVREAVVRLTHQQPQLAAMQFAGHRGGSFRLRRTNSS